MLDLHKLATLDNIVLLRSMIRKWWGLELHVADSKGRVIDTEAAPYCAPDNDFCRAALLSKKSYRRCSESIKTIVGKLKHARSGTFVAQCHMGFELIASPILIKNSLEGFVFVEGAVRHEPTMVTRDALANTLFELGADGSLDAQSANVPRLQGQDLEHLSDLVERAAKAIAIAGLSQLGAGNRSELASHDAFPNIIGQSQRMRELFRMLQKIVKSHSTVLINGESGTGKELVARAIHDSGPRRDQPFIVQNCSAFNDNLLESALFGHLKGSFTGAVQDKKGLFEAAHGGTFFLDEIGDMSPALQVRLLRVLQEGTLSPVGSTEVRKVDVRIIAATHKNLLDMVERASFREDLYYRINVIHVELPGLRQRMEDLPLLIEHFLQKHGGAGSSFDDESKNAMQRYMWPGNIRELENEIERVLVLGADQPRLTADLLSPRIRQAAKHGAPVPMPLATRAGTLKEAVESVEREMIQQGLISMRWNKSKLAKKLGISRSNLIQKCNQYGLNRKN